MLSRKKHYLQIALNSTLPHAASIIASLPYSDRIILEAGTPLLKRHGAAAISYLRDAWMAKAGWGQSDLPYIVADMKTIDRGETKVTLAAQYGASAITAMGYAPMETLCAFIEACEKTGLDAMIDMMNVKTPWKILQQLPKKPLCIILHRGVDEERYNKSKSLPIYDINKIKGTADVLVAIAGGDTPREIQSAAFNGADIVVVWKNFYQASAETSILAETFLKEIK